MEPLTNAEYVRAQSPKCKCTLQEDLWIPTSVNSQTTTHLLFQLQQEHKTEVKCRKIEITNETVSIGLNKTDGYCCYLKCVHIKRLHTLYQRHVHHFLRLIIKRIQLCGRSLCLTSFRSIPKLSLKSLDWFPV